MPSTPLNAKIADAGLDLACAVPDDVVGLVAVLAAAAGGERGLADAAPPGELLL